MGTQRNRGCPYNHLTKHGKMSSLSEEFTVKRKMGTGLLRKLALQTISTLLFLSSPLLAIIIRVPRDQANHNKERYAMNRAELSFALTVFFATCATGEVNGQGTLDLAAANFNVSGNGIVSILINNGNGTFAPRVDYGTGNEPSSVFAADFNGDGKPDLAVANSNVNGNGTASILRNNGDGTFVPKVDYGTGTLPVSVFAADFNGDGKPDLAVANGLSNTVSILLNNGNGTFAAHVDYGTGNGPLSVFAADLNGDGKPDLAVADVGGPSILMNNGDGTFAAAVGYGNFTGNDPASVFAVDLNGDGKPDLAVANYGNNTVSIFLNNGDGTFAAEVDYATGGQPYSVFAADLNGDGKPDLAVANFNFSGNGTVSILRNNGNGTFAPKVDYGTGTEPISVFAADLNGDGKPDLAVANFNGNTVSILRNNGDGTFAPKVDYGTGDGPASVFATDLNGDGKPDLAVANNTVCSAARGDMNASGDLSPADVVLMLNCVFLASGNCDLCFADVNCSGGLSPADVVIELNAVFLAASFPC